MQTSAGIADEEIDLTGRSGHWLPAAAKETAAVAAHTAIRQKEERRVHFDGLRGIGNDYNRRYREVG
jgi:hypothetical protein